MSTVDLHPVTPANWRACAALSVRADQARFVAPVSYYLCLCTYGDRPSAMHPETQGHGPRSVGFVETGETEE